MIFGRQVAKSLFLKLPTPWQSVVDYYVRARDHDQWGGPFNGQAFRQQIFQEIIESCQPKAIVETGTFQGSTTVHFARKTHLPIYTAESNPRYFYYAKHRLKNYPAVKLYLGDSREFLKKLAKSPRVSRDRVFFYLDAHWEQNLPLREEVELIGQNWQGFVIMVDDFEVPGDPGYCYDDYGPGKRLCLDYLAPFSESSLAVFFPAQPSEKETGQQRGCVVLADAASAERLRSVPSLRPYSWRQ